MRIVILLLLSVLVLLHFTTVPLLAASDHLACREKSTVAAQQGEPAGKMGREPWPSTNWGLVAALTFTGIGVATVIVILTTILSWPHRKP